MREDVINVTTPITLLLDNRFYFLTKTTFFYKSYVDYDKGTHLIYNNALFECVENIIAGENPNTHKNKFKEIKPIDFLSRSLTTDDIRLFETDYVKSVNGIKPVNGNVDIDVSDLHDNSVKSVNGIEPVDGNVDIDIPTNYVSYVDEGSCKTIIFNNGDSISFNKDGACYNILKYDDNIVIGNNEAAINLISKNDVTLNGAIIPSVENVLTLDDSEQLVDGVKAFKQIILMDSPYEINHAVSFQFMNEHVKTYFNERCKEKLNSDTTFYVSINGDDNNDGSEESPLRTFEAAIQKIYSVNCNNKQVTIDFLTDYYEDETIHFLKNCESSFYINIINSKNKKVELSSFKCSSGKWYFSDVVIRDSKDDSSCVEVKENGYVKFFNVVFKLFNTNNNSDCIKIHHNGTVYFIDGSNIKFINETAEHANAAIHVYMNGVVFGGNGLDSSSFFISNVNGNFKTAFEIEKASKCLGFENSVIEVGENVKQYILRDISCFYVGNSIKSGAMGEKDSTSFII